MMNEDGEKALFPPLCATSVVAMFLRSQVRLFQSTTFRLCLATEATSNVLARAAQVRADVQHLWNEVVEAEAQNKLAAMERSSRLKDILERHNLKTTTPRNESVARALGDAFDRALLIIVPFEDKSAETLEVLLTIASHNDIQISVRTIQHLFSRAASYVEALTLFSIMRKCHVAMNMEAYHAMMYSLQRLDEESWALRYNEEYRSKGEVSEEALDFIIDGVPHQLLPENKPWLGRIMYRDTDEGGKKALESYDRLQANWLERYKRSQ